MGRPPMDKPDFSRSAVKAALDRLDVQSQQPRGTVTMAPIDDPHKVAQYLIRKIYIHGPRAIYEQESQAQFAKLKQRCLEAFDQVCATLKEWGVSDAQIERLAPRDKPPPPHDYGVSKVNGPATDAAAREAA